MVTQILSSPTQEIWRAPAPVIFDEPAVTPVSSK
jgi:hypothetical protein